MWTMLAWCWGGKMMCVYSTGMTRYLPGSRAILANSSRSSSNEGRLSASSIQPACTSSHQPHCTPLSLSVTTVVLSVPNVFYLWGQTRLLYPSSERSETGGYTVFTFVCLSVCVCVCALSPVFNSVCWLCSSHNGSAISLMQPMSLPQPISLGGYMHSLSAF